MHTYYEEEKPQPNFIYYLLRKINDGWVTQHSLLYNRDEASIKVYVNILD
jgi:hypothetical protein